VSQWLPGRTVHTTFYKKLTVIVGAQYPYGQLRFQARIHFQGMTTLTAAEVVEAVGKVPAEYGRLTNICRALGALTKIACTDGKPDKSEKELQVFCNPLFGSV
jgi:hypothetical protein